MITKKQAARFREKTLLGERPPVPEKIRHLLAETPKQIASDIRHAKAFQYGSRTNNDAKTLQRMGLMGDDYSLTEIGREYALAYLKKFFENIALPSEEPKSFIPFGQLRCQCGKSMEFRCYECQKSLCVEHSHYTEVGQGKTDHCILCGNCLSRFESRSSGHT
jgi:hypothetical protein